MPSLGTICSLLLLSVLWVDLAMAGSSFLSPEHQKVQVRHLPTKPGASHANLAMWQPAECAGQYTLSGLQPSPRAKGLWV